MWPWTSWVVFFSSIKQEWCKSNPHWTSVKLAAIRLTPAIPNLFTESLQQYESKTLPDTNLCLKVHKSCIPNRKHVGQITHKFQIMISYAQESNRICIHHSSLFIRDSHFLLKQCHYLSLAVSSSQPLFAEVLGTLGTKTIGNSYWPSTWFDSFTAILLLSTHIKKKNLWKIIIRII